MTNIREPWKRRPLSYIIDTDVYGPYSECNFSAYSPERSLVSFDWPWKMNIVVKSTVEENGVKLVFRLFVLSLEIRRVRAGCVWRYACDTGWTCAFTDRSDAGRTRPRRVARSMFGSWFPCRFFILFVLYFTFYYRLRSRLQTGANTSDGHVYKRTRQHVSAINNVLWRVHAHTHGDADENRVTYLILFPKLEARRSSSGRAIFEPALCRCRLEDSFVLVSPAPHICFNFFCFSLASRLRVWFQSENVRCRKSTRTILPASLLPVASETVLFNYCVRRSQ